MVHARSADQPEAVSQRPSRTVESDACTPGRDPELAGDRRDGSSIHVTAPEHRRVHGLERRQLERHASAHDALELPVEARIDYSRGGKASERSAPCGAAAVVCGDGVRKIR